MTGICGSTTRLQQILSTISHRGDKNLEQEALGIALLEIEGRVQHDPQWVMDGDVYNFSEPKLSNVRKYDGEYAIAWIEDSLHVARDVLGYKPLFVNDNGEFCSENTIQGREVLPGQILKWDGNWQEIAKREIPKPLGEGSQEVLKKAIVEAVDKRSKLKEAALLFSGGVDSTLLAVLLQDRLRLKCYTTGIEGSKDVHYSEQVASELGLDHTIEVIERDEIEEALPKVIKIIKSDNIMKVGVAMTGYFAARNTHEKIIFSGLGSEEVFAGYSRHRKALEQGFDAVQEECWAGLKTMWQRDLDRDDLLVSSTGKELRAPFLDSQVIQEAMKIPADQKISAETSKVVLRAIAKELGVPQIAADRPKQAAQYGSGIDKTIRKILKSNSKALNI